MTAESGRPPGRPGEGSGPNEAGGAPAGLAVVRIGEAPPEIVAHLAAFLEETLRRPTRVLDEEIDPGFAFEPQRSQFNCRRLLPELRVLAGRHGVRVLGVADVDLFSPVFTFVFGEAHVGGDAGLFSLFRLRAPFYGLPADREQLLARARREALHETGHLLGLIHCHQVECVMRFSGAVEEVDLKRDVFCGECRGKVTGGG